MSNIDIYERITSKMFNKIKNMRDASSLSSVDNMAMPTSSFFDYGGNKLRSYTFLLNESEKITFRMIAEIISDLCKGQKIVVELPPEQVFNDYPVLFIFENEGWSPWVIQRFGLPSIDNNLIREHFIDSFPENNNRLNIVRYLCLVEDEAYRAIFNHNSNINDPSRETALYGLKDFFKLYFDEQEYGTFKKYVEAFSEKVKNYLSMSAVEYLSSNVVHFFRRKISRSLNSFPFEKYVLAGNNQSGLLVEHNNHIRKQFIDCRLFEAIIGPCDFAESFVTAEWLYDSLRSASNIDFTPIAMGYFKSIEQLLFTLLKFHKNQGRTIHRTYKKNQVFYLDEDNTKKYFKVNDFNLQNKNLDITLGSLISFFSGKHKLNKDLLQVSLLADDTTYLYIHEIMKRILSLRNGFVHKDNLHDWNRIVEIRNNTYIVLYLILGAYKFSDEERAILGILPLDQFQLLCEYVHYHDKSPYYIDWGNGEIEMYFSSRDDNIRYNEYGEPIYSGLYLRVQKHILPNNHIIPLETIMSGEMINMIPQKYTSADLRTARIYIGAMNPVSSGIELSGPKTLIYENGIFLVDPID